MSRIPNTARNYSLIDIRIRTGSFKSLNWELPTQPEVLLGQEPKFVRFESLAILCVEYARKVGRVRYLEVGIPRWNMASEQRNSRTVRPKSRERYLT
jgi:hypothetical protein